MIIKKDVFYDEPDGEDLYFALAFMLDLTERSGLIDSATRNISALSLVFVGRSEGDLSARDEWRHIVSSLSIPAQRSITDLLLDMRPRDVHWVYSQIPHIRELQRATEKFRFNKMFDKI